jgi:eukaryotic-like serine/threonine-protein kinase
MAHALPTMTVLSVASLFGWQGGAPWQGLCLAVAAGLVWLGSSVFGAKARAASASDSSKTEEKLGPYTLDEKIGEGGMGVVYKASHELLRRPAAIKLLASERTGEENLKRFEREVQVTSMLTHPNTVAIYDFGRTPAGGFYYAMEYLDGLDLQTLVEEHGPQEPARVAHILAQLAGALAEAHGAGVVHRDVKPANVMLCERGGQPDVVKVLDFGLTKELSPQNDVLKSDVHRIIGTPLYLSPEAVTDPASVDAQSDLYAVGAVGYFLLTGAPPFSGKNTVELCGHHLYSTPTPISARRGAPVPAELEALVMSCLEKRPGERPASAAALESALSSLAAQWTRESARAWWNGRHETETSHEHHELARTVRASGFPSTVDLAAQAA